MVQTIDIEATNKAREAAANSGQDPNSIKIYQDAGPSPISADSLRPVTKINLPNVPADNNNYSGILAGVNSIAGSANDSTQAQNDWFTKYLSGMEENQPQETSGMYNDLYSQYGIAEKANKVNDINTRLQAINAESQAAKIGLEDQAAKTGDVTTSFLSGRQAAIDRSAALKALPLSIELAGAQGALETAQTQLSTVFKLQSDDAEKKYTYKKDLIKSVYDYADKSQQRELDRLDKEEDRKFTLLRDNMGYAQSLAKTAIENGASGLAAKISALDPSSPTYTQDLGKLAGMIPQDQTKLLQQQKLRQELAGGTMDTENLVDSSSQSILAQTGLSMPAFQYLTTGTAALTRMTAAQRQQYMSEAADWANKNNVDLSTFKSQYAALSKTVEANVLRNNQAAVAESEVDATLQNLTTAGDDASFGKMRWNNVLKMFSGKEFNDANVSKYSFHLNQLREEFAMYNAALAGQIDANGNIRQINEADYKKAEAIIKDGFAKGSITGFEEALKASREKMQVVLQNSINAQNKQVWKLFGVDGNYKTTENKNVNNVENAQMSDVQETIKAHSSDYKTREQLIDAIAKAAPSLDINEIAREVYSLIPDKK